MVLTKKLCVLCFQNHSVDSCSFRFCCKVCGGRHNTAIHTDNVSVNSCNALGSVLLATAVVMLEGVNGSHHNARFLIDQGSMSSFVSESVAQTLKLPRKYASTTVSGFGGAEVVTKGKTVLKFRSIYDDTVFNIPTLIIDQFARVKQCIAAKFISTGIGRQEVLDGRRNRWNFGGRRVC